MTHTAPAKADYATELQTLSEGSVNLHFDPFVDIDWDSPEFEIRRDDPRWVLVDYDPLSQTDWYKSLPQDKQIEIGMWRVTNMARVGLEFEALLIRGMMQFIITLQHQNPEFRYCLHEMTEECNHIQMFQELVNRTGLNVPGLGIHYKIVSAILPLLAADPVTFFIAVLAGEEPIDHFQKALARAGFDRLPTPVARVFQIHVAEEARHISFAHMFITRRLERANAVQRLLLGLALPIIMRLAGGFILGAPRGFRRQFNVPRTALRQAFWRSPQSRKLMRDSYSDVRTLAEDTRLLTPATRWVWKLLRIDGPTARYRSEPADFRRAS
ncbi:diiron oxygenase [Pseudonocardiaceae bacterium YIM PH 21723]|nr:diiron oxygenase [Pseudonocardiaceae bacterium YIM PH 21723]